MDKYYKIAEKDINAVLGYLGTRSYTDVAGIISVLQKVEPIEEKEPEDET